MPCRVAERDAHEDTLGLKLTKTLTLALALLRCEREALVLLQAEIERDLVGLTLE